MENIRFAGLDVRPDTITVAVVEPGAKFDPICFGGSAKRSIGRKMMRGKRGEMFDRERGKVAR